MKRNISCFILLLFLVFVSFYGCASYKPTPLPNLQPEFAPYSENIENVTLASKALSEEECKKYFDRDIIGIGYQPVQMTIINDTDNSILFHPDGVSLPVCPPEEVAKKCYTSTAGRATAYGVGALFLWPLAIPAIVDGAKSYEANTELDKDFGERNIGQMEIIPHTTHNGVIFISGEAYQESFIVKLVNKETRQKLEFYVKDLGGQFTLKETAKPIATLSPATVDPTEPWTGVWAVDGGYLMGGIWGMKQSGSIVKSTGDSNYDFKGKVRGNRLEGKIKGDYDVYRNFVIKISSDGLTFEGKSEIHHLKGKRKTGNMASIAPVSLNINEPWTGKWKVEGHRGGMAGVWALKQRSNKIISTEDSMFEIEGRAIGSQFEGKLKAPGQENYFYSIKVKISSDGMSFKGTTSGNIGNDRGFINGRRVE